MARARIVKPSLFTNDELAACGPFAMLLFEGLWCHADRKGRLADKPQRLKVQILPYFDEDVDALLAKLEQSKFIIRYEVDGAKYIQVVGFEKHQRPHINEQNSEIPPPTKVVTKHNQGSANEQPKQCQDTTKASSTPPIYLNPLPLTLNPSKEDCSKPVRKTRTAIEPALVEIQIPTNKNGHEFPILKTKAKEWGETYPGVDVPQTLKEIRQWCVDNPAKRKTDRGMHAFIGRWMAREQNRGT